MVPKAGLEPARLAPHAPQTCVSAIPPLRLSRDVEKTQRLRSRGALILDVPGTVRLESSLPAALPLAFLNIPPSLTLKMPALSPARPARRDALFSRHRSHIAWALDVPTKSTLRGLRSLRPCRKHFKQPPNSILPTAWPFAELPAASFKGILSVPHEFQSPVLMRERHYRSRPKSLSINGLFCKIGRRLLAD